MTVEIAQHRLVSAFALNVACELMRLSDTLVDSTREGVWGAEELCGLIGEKFTELRELLERGETKLGRVSERVHNWYEPE